MYKEVERKTIVDEEDMENGYRPPGAGKTQQQRLLDKDTIRMQAEVDFHAQQIYERQEAFDQAENLMKDINEISH